MTVSAPEVSIPAWGCWDGSRLDESLESAIYRARMRRVLAWVEGLGLPSGAPVLDVGCGAGLLSTAVAELGYAVRAVDTSETMVELARQNGAAAGVELDVGLGDAHALEEQSSSYELVLAIGLLPWLRSPAQGLSELVRVLRPGGSMVVTADNPRRLVWLLDPRFQPALAPLKRLVRRHEQRLISCRAADRLLAGAGLRKERGETVGFGPLTFLGAPVLPERPAAVFEGWLQGLADRRVPGLRAGWRQYLVLARKPRGSVRSKVRRIVERDSADRGCVTGD